MKIEGKVAVVTGGAGGIGGAIARAFGRAGARVVVTDLDVTGAEAVARDAGGIAIRADVGQEQDLVRLIQQVEQGVGPIDLFVSNAGIVVPGGAEVPDPDWDRIWRINTMAHVWAARALVPDMLRRGSGYLVSVASAAGLLTQIGSAPYAVTKHAALAFAEWLAVTYGDRGIKVSCICPLGVKTTLLDTQFGALTEYLKGDAVEPDVVAEAALGGIEREEFLILPQPKARDYVRRKWDDTERWLRGMQRLRREAEGQ